MSYRNQSSTKIVRSRRFSFEGLVVASVAAALIFVAPFTASGNSAPFPGSQNQKKNQKKGGPAPAIEKSAALQGLPITDLNESEAILHALNRLTYGPRPGDLEAVRQMGLAKWIDQQLNPDSIADSAMQARLEKYPTLHMSSAKLYSEFPQPQQAAKRQGISVEEYRKQQQARQQQVNQQMTAMENAEQVGSSRVDLQACKLEYSIVSPK